MKILDHRLTGDDGQSVLFQQSPNVGGALSAKYLVMHYTAGSSASGAIASMLKPEHKASAHLLIARDGAITQLVPFNRVAWHAGDSRWDGLNGLNQHSIGIELDNAGVFEKQGGQWRAWFARTYPDSEVFVANHKHETRVRGWHTYTEAQLAVAVNAASAIASHYKLLDVIGHDDIAPGRKVDPGPAFPMDSFRASVIGRGDDAPQQFRTLSELNIRSGPGTDFEKITDKALAKGTRLRLLSRDASWCFVEVLDEDDEPNLTGWVYGYYIERV